MLTGRNANVRGSLTAFEEWDKTHGFDDSYSDSGDSDSDKDGRNNKDDEDEGTI